MNEGKKKHIQWTTREYGLTRWRRPMYLLVFIGGPIIGGLLAFGITYTSFAYGKSLDHRKCERIERYIGQDTVWADYSHWSWECLTLVDGQYVDANDYKRIIQVRLMGGTR